MKTDWQKIAAARTLLGLAESASVPEIRKAYRRLSKQHHPDLAVEKSDAGRQMQEITLAYRLLLDYCADYKIPLIPGLGENKAAEDWWMDRFGHDPLWSKTGE